MAITSIVRDWGVNPAIVRITSTDTLATCSSSGYISAQSANISKLNGGAFQFVSGDTVLVSASDGSEQFFFSGTDFSTLVPTQILGEVTPTEVQQSAFNYGIDTGTADNYAVALHPAVTTLTDGLLVAFQPLHNNATSSPSLSINGLTAASVVSLAGTALLADDFSVNGVAFLIYSATQGVFNLLNPQASSIATYSSIQLNGFIWGQDSGVAANTYVWNGVTGNSFNNAEGSLIAIGELNAANTGASTLNINGTAIPIILPNGSALTGGELLTTFSYLLFFTNNSLMLLNAIGAGSGVTSTQVQQSAFNYGIDTGTADNYAVTLNPAVTTLTDGLIVTFTPANNNVTSTPTLQVNALSAIPVYAAGDQNQLQCEPGDFSANFIAVCIYDAATNIFILTNPQISYASASQVQANGYGVANDSGTADNYVLTNTIIGTITTLNAGTIVAFTPANSNTTTTPVANYNTTGVLPVTLLNGGAVQANDIQAGITCILVFATGAWSLLNPLVSAGGISALQVQQSAFNVAGADTGTADNYVITLSPPTASLTNGLLISFIPANSNTGTTFCNVTVDGNTAVTISISNQGSYSIPQVDDLTAGVPVYMIYDSTNTKFLLLNPHRSYTNEVNVTAGAYYWYGHDTGTGANAYVWDSSASALYQEAPLFVVIDNINATNTGASTITIGGAATTFDIVNADGSALSSGAMVTGGAYFLYWSINLNQYILTNSSLSGGGGVTSTQVQQSAFNHGIDSGTADNYIVTLNPAVTSLTDGLIVTFVPSNANTIYNPVITINALSPARIILVDGAYPQFMAAGDLNPDCVAVLIYSVSQGSFYLLNPFISQASGSAVWQNIFSVAATNSGSADHYAATFQISNIGSFLTKGTSFIFTPIATNLTYFPTLDYGAGATVIVGPDNLSCYPSDLIVDQMAIAYFNGSTNLQLLNPSMPSPSGFIQAPMTGDTINLAYTRQINIINPAGTLATLTVNLPEVLINGHVIRWSSTQTITALTVTSTIGSAIVGPVSTMFPGQSVAMIYNSGTWYPA